MHKLSKKIVVIGCGNLNRSDDGVGVIVAHRLKERLSVPPHQDVAIFDAGTGGMDIMFQARAASTLLIIDACCSGSEPGTVFKLSGEELAAQPTHGYSLHDFRWDHALYVGRKIFAETFPSDVTVFLVEAASTSLGLEVCPSVSLAADKVVGYIQDQIERSAQQEGALSTETDHPGPSSECVHVRGGSIYMESCVYSAYFSGLDSLVLLRQDRKMLMFPVRHAAAGGLLIKVRNARGDRVVHAQDFLTNEGVDGQREWTLPVRWDSRAGALVADWPSDIDS